MSVPKRAKALVCPDCNRWWAKDVFRRKGQRCGEWLPHPGIACPGELFLMEPFREGPMSIEITERATRYIVFLATTGPITEHCPVCGGLMDQTACWVRSRHVVPDPQYSLGISQMLDVWCAEHGARKDESDGTSS